MPILGIIASSFRSAAGPEGAYDALATVTVPSGGTSSITFSGIPTGYKHLQIRLSARASRSGESNDFVTIQYNGDTGSNYSWHAVEGSGTTVYAEGAASTASPRYGDITASTATANTFGVGVIDILDYANTSKNTTLRTLTGRDQNGAGWVWFGSGAWYNTAAVTSMLIKPTFGTDFQQYSQFALYGVK